MLKLVNVVPKPLQFSQVYLLNTAKNAKDREMEIKIDEEYDLKSSSSWKELKGNSLMKNGPFNPSKEQGTAYAGNASKRW